MGLDNVFSAVWCKVDVPALLWPTCDQNLIINSFFQQFRSHSLGKGIDGLMNQRVGGMNNEVLGDGIALVHCYEDQAAFPHAPPPVIYYF
jgi:hypothetical protein